MELSSGLGSCGLYVCVRETHRESMFHKCAEERIIQRVRAVEKKQMELKISVFCSVEKHATTTKDVFVLELISILSYIMTVTCGCPGDLPSVSA